MAIEARTTYITSDGRKWDTEEAAQQHEAIEPEVAAYIAATGETGRAASRTANVVRAFLHWRATQDTPA